MKNLTVLFLAILVASCCQERWIQDYLLDEDGEVVRLENFSYKVVPLFRPIEDEQGRKIWVPENSPEELQLLELATKEAIAQWNDRLGFKLLSYKDSEGYNDVDVTIKFKRTTRKKLYGDACLRSKSRRVQGPIIYDVHIYNENLPELYEDVDFWVEVIKHEIGHSLGLGHNDIKGSLMYCKFQRNRKISSRSIKLLGELYPELEITDDWEDPWDANPRIHKLGEYQSQN